MTLGFAGRRAFGPRSIDRMPPACSSLERVAGIESASQAWKASALPLSYTRAGAVPCHRRASHVNSHADRMRCPEAPLAAL